MKCFRYADFTFVRSWGPLALGILAVFLPAVARAVTYTWDTDGAAGNGVTDGAGVWNATGTNWYSSGTDSAWISGSDVIFGGGGTGGVVSLASTMTANTVTFNNSGYVLSGGALALGLNSGSTLTTTNVTVAAGVSAEIDSYLSAGSISALFNGGTGSTLTLVGGGAVNTWGLNGSGTTYNLTAGSYTATVFESGASVNIGAATVTAGNFIVGQSTTGSSSTPSLVINDPNAVFKMTTVGGTNYIGRNSKSGTFDLQQGTVTLASNLMVTYDTNSTGLLKIEGGTFTLGSGTALYINYAGTGSGKSGVVTLSGGTFTTPSIVFGGGTSTFASGTIGSLTVTGGALYIGSGGISEASDHPTSDTISLSGGTVGASSDWSSSMAMTLATTSGNITFQASDSLGTAHAITLSGILSGSGGLNKTGGGLLTLSGANAYTGATSVSAGTLSVTGSLGNTTTTVSSGATLMGVGTIGGVTTVTSGAILIAGDGVTAGTTLTFSKALTMNSGSTLEFVLGAGNTHSTLALSSSAANSLASNLSITFLGIQTGTYDNIITGLSADVGEGSWTITNAGYSAIFTFDGSNIDVVVAAVPEPGVAMLLLAAPLFMLFRRRLGILASQAR